ncbi:hypothetical protein ACLOJK_035625 [Asimina triloba]
MAEGIEGGGCGEIERLSPRVKGYPRDLLRRFVAEYRCQDESPAGEAAEIELNLGLSLGGCFGVDREEKRLVRASSIAGLEMRDLNAVPLPAASTGLIRTCSLPAETEEERRKRREMQSLRRMEAKRKRSEKQRNSRAGRDRASLERSSEEDKRVEEEGPFGLPLKGKMPGGATANGFSSQPYALPAWAAAAARGIDAANGKSSAFAAAVALRGFPPSSQGSLGSQGSSSSGLSDFGSRSIQAILKPLLGWLGSSQLSDTPTMVGLMDEHIRFTSSLLKVKLKSSARLAQYVSMQVAEKQRGSSSCMEARSPASVQSLPEHFEHKTVTPVTPTPAKEKSVKRSTDEVDNPSRKPDTADNGGGVREMGRNVMEEMPCVSTRGDGPNGRRIEGFLYKYRMGQEVRIVCVCHGSFLSPAEFVRHAGGGDVAHPLRHIVVNPSPSSLL